MSQLNSKYFHLFAGVHVVNGYARSFLVNLEQGNAIPIPKLMGEILLKLENKPFLNFIEENYKDDKEGIIKFIEYFKNQKFGCFVNSSDEFVFVDLMFEHPFVVSNCLFDINEHTTTAVTKRVFNEIDHLNVPALQIRFLAHNNDVLDDVFFRVKNATSIQSIELIVPLSARLEKLKCELLDFHNLFLYVYDTKKKGTHKNESDEFIYVNVPNRSNVMISRNSITVSRRLFYESYQYNTYFNQKVYFSPLGDVSNGELNLKSYGNILNDFLIDIVQKTDFTQYNSVTKDRIVACRDCELRRCCVDSRVPHILNSNDLWGFDTECPYNPYIAKWNTEEGYQTVAESIADGVVSEEFVYRALDV